MLILFDACVYVSGVSHYVAQAGLELLGSVFPLQPPKAAGIIHAHATAPGIFRLLDQLFEGINCISFFFFSASVSQCSVCMYVCMYLSIRARVCGCLCVETSS